METVERLLGIIFTLGIIPILLFRTAKRTRKTVTLSLVACLLNSILAGGLLYGFGSFLEIPSFGGFGKLAGVDINGAWIFAFVSYMLSSTWLNLRLDNE